MEILLQLGANKTAFIQFFVFAISIAVLTIFVYGPFYKAYDQRLENTKGADSVAKSTVEEAKKLGLIYQNKAREINDKVKNIFDLQRTEGLKISEDLLKTAKKDSEMQLSIARTEIENNKNTAQKQISSLTAEIAEQLTKKMEEGL